MTTTPTPTLLDPAFTADPRGGFGALREEAPVTLGTGMDGMPVWIVTRQADVRALLGDPRFRNDGDALRSAESLSAKQQMIKFLGVPEELAGYLTDSILRVDGADHTRVRKLVSRAFTVKRVAALRPRVEQITAELLDGLTDPAELVEDLAYPLPIRVICELVGVPEADRPAWRRWANALSALDPSTIPVAMREMVDHIHDLIARRRADPRDDLITALVEAHEEGDRHGVDDRSASSLSDTELVTMVFAIVMAGHETTAHLIANGTHALLSHADQLALLRREPQRWPDAVSELMRWCGPVIATANRYAAEDLELAGTRIARGDGVMGVVVSANFDPRVYQDPDRFDVTRQPAQRGDGHVGFGHGIHYCLGAALARQEGEVALRALVERFPDLALVEPEPDRLARPGMQRLATLRVRLHVG